jgi:peptidoglycan L-alanyl-D-glutamate endopeptidase CwlK
MMQRLLPSSLRFLKNKEGLIKQALLADDLATARRVVNGGTHGVDAFANAYRTGERLIPNA